MIRQLGNQRGNIALAMVLALVGVICFVTFMLMVITDTVSTRNACDRVQQFFLLRSESKRAQVILENIETLEDGMYLPTKYVTIASSHARNTFELKTRIVQMQQDAESELFHFNQYRVLSLVSEQRGGNNAFTLAALNAPVKTCSERMVRRCTLSGYHYLTDNESSPNNTNSYFWGPDVVYGKVHSNTDIWLKQAGGGNNNGWPTFYGPVYTSGMIKSFSGMPPFSLVFRNGYWEHVTEVDFTLTAESIRANGVTVGPAVYDPNRIVYVKINGPTYTSMIGYVYDMGMDTLDVWSEYPPPDGQYLFQNRFHHYDTLWTPGSQGSILNRSAMVYSKLWLQGSFHGAQTWCSADTLYLTGSCTLDHTPIGSVPDGSIPGSNYNHMDILGIVSEKSILVKYGLKDPETNERLHPNCGGSNNGIWIYAALCALGDGNGDSHRDGVFSFEYQHPHPSVPDIRFSSNSHLWDKIDLHRHKYPQTDSAPWPSNLDYPYYNPLWPEASPYLERGQIHLRGSVAQRRRGFVHRGLQDGEYPNPGGIWNIPLDLCGGTSNGTYNDPVLGLSLTPVNAVGTSLGGIGYTKDYRYDFRFDEYCPPDFPELTLVTRKAVYEQGEWFFKRPPKDLNHLK